MGHNSRFANLGHAGGAGRKIMKSRCKAEDRRGCADSEMHHSNLQRESADCSFTCQIMPAMRIFSLG
jgi:hypothetical protein